MSNVVPMRVVEPGRPRDLTVPQMALVRRTVAADATSDEFDMLMAIANRAGLDPLRRQIYCVVYNKDDEKKRKVSFITGIDGFRAVAARNGDYRPDDQEPLFVTDPELEGPSNPRGLVKATVKAFKRHGTEWHPVVGVAYWSEFAPMKTDGAFRWEDTGEVWPDSGKPKKRKVPLGETVEVPSGKWATMPFVMLAKCAESQALRKGWPEDLSGIYAPEEMEGPMRDITPSEEIAQHQTQERLQRVHATNAVPILWKAGEPNEYVPEGQMADRALAFIRDAESVTQIEWWTDTNVGGLREFWALAPTDALGVKKAREERVAALAT